MLGFAALGATDLGGGPLGLNNISARRALSLTSGVRPGIGGAPLGAEPLGAQVPGARISLFVPSFSRGASYTGGYPGRGIGGHAIGRWAIGQATLRNERPLKLLLRGLLSASGASYSGVSGSLGEFGLGSFGDVTFGIEGQGGAKITVTKPAIEIMASGASFTFGTLAMIRDRDGILVIFELTPHDVEMPLSMAMAS